jgi:tetratricopeptide (TPR) repeat protein
VLGFELKADYRNDSADNVESYARTNAFGLRDKHRSIAKPQGTERVILLGDSVVEGYGLPEHETISQQWEGLYSDREVEILNFGTSAYCTRAEVELLERKGLKFTPDVVVLLFVENDFDNFNREAFPLGGTIDRPAVINRLFHGSHFFRLTCVRLNLFHYAAEFDPVAWNQDAIGDNNVVVGLRRFKELADQHGFKSLLAVWPRFFDDRIEDSPILNDDLLVVERLARMHGIVTVRLSDFFRKDLKTLGENANPRLRYTLGDQLHPSAEGCRVAARAFRQILADLQSGQLAISGINANADDTDAIEMARVLGSDQPNYSRVHNRLGTDLLRKGKFTEAVEQFQLALAEDPENAGAYNNLGLAYERLGRDEARQQFKRAIVIQPDFAMAHFNLARLLLRNGHQDVAMRGLAMRGFRQVLQIDPNHIGTLNLLGRELGKQREFADAQMFLVRAVRLDPHHAEAQNNLGVVLAAQGKLRVAVEHFRAALSADPNHKRAAANLRSTQNLLP